MPVCRQLPLQPRKAISHLCDTDERLGRAIRIVGSFRLPRREPSLHLLCASIIGQSISVKAAASLVRRFNEVVGDAESLTPSRVLKLSEDDLRGLGMNRMKAGALRGVAELWRRKRWNPDVLRRVTDEELDESMTQVKGVGPWTVKMFLIFGLRRPDVLPSEDLGFAEGLKRIYNLRERPKRRAEVESLTEGWKPWRTVGVVYAWKYLLAEQEMTLESGNQWWTERKVR